MIFQESDALDSIEQLSHHYDIGSQDGVIILGNNENLVFEASGKVVRLSSFAHRTKEEIDGEVTLLGVLGDTRCSVVRIIPSKNGEESVNIDINGELVHVVVFEKAAGYIKTIEDFGELRTELIYEWGRSMGEIHKKTAENPEALLNLKRLNWDEEVIITDAHRLLPPGEGDIYEALLGLVGKIQSLPKATEDFGLVHTDMRPRNFHVNGTNIIHFDFDDICYHWYVYDIVVSLLHEAEGKEDVEERTKFIVDFLQTFMKGYLSANTINSEIFGNIINFMKLRLYYAYIDYYKRIVIKKIDSGYDKMLIRKGYIENFESFIDIHQVQIEIDKLINL